MAGVFQIFFLLFFKSTLRILLGLAVAVTIPFALPFIVHIKARSLHKSHSVSHFRRTLYTASLVANIVLVCLLTYVDI